MLKYNTLCNDCGNLVRGSVTNCPCKKKRKRKSKPDIYTTAKWRKFRKQILKRDNECCQCCLTFNWITKTTLQIHHIKPRNKYPELTYEATNCVTLCQLCNQYGTAEELDFDFTAKEIEQHNIL